MTRQDQIIALIRTAVPALVGALLAFVIAHIPGVAGIIAVINGLLVAWGFAGVSVSVILQALVVGAVIALYYWIARQVGRRWPAAEKWLLGHGGLPVYTIVHNGVANAGLDVSSAPSTSTAPPKYGS
jgi:hypothetical protein